MSTDAIFLVCAIVSAATGIVSVYFGYKQARAADITYREKISEPRKPVDKQLPPGGEGRDWVRISFVWGLVKIGLGLILFTVGTAGLGLVVFISRPNPPASGGQVTNQNQEQAKEQQAKLDQAKLDQAKLDQAKLDQAKLDQAKLDQAKLDQAKLDQAKADQAKADQAKADQAKADQAKADQAKLDQAKADQAKADQAKRDQQARDQLAKEQEARAQQAKEQQAKEELAKEQHGTTAIVRVYLESTDIPDAQAVLDQVKNTCLKEKRFALAGPATADVTIRFEGLQRKNLKFSINGPNGTVSEATVTREIINNKWLADPIVGAADVCGKL